MKCIQCNKSNAGETPFLCVPCFRYIYRQWFYWHHRDPNDLLEVTEERFGIYLSKTRQKCWDSYENIEAGRVALPNQAQLLT